MDWWLKLKDKIRGREERPAGREADRKEPRLPSYIIALCSVSNESAFSVEITSLSVSGLKLHTPRRLRTNSSLNLRVPVGLNFEDRDTQEYVAFNGVAVWSQKRSNGQGFECGVRYTDEENAKRDRWIQLVLQTYGLSIGDDRRAATDPRYEVLLPVKLHRGNEQVVDAVVRNISLGGLQVAFSNVRLEANERLLIEFVPQGGVPALALGGQAVHGHLESDSGKHVYGIAFDTLDELQRESVVNMVSDLSKKAIAARASEPLGDHEA